MEWLMANIQLRTVKGTFFVNGHYSSHINEPIFCLEFYLEMIQTLFCVCLLDCSLSVDHMYATIARHAAISSSSTSFTPGLNSLPPHSLHLKLSCWQHADGPPFAGRCHITTAHRLDIHDSNITHKTCNPPTSLCRSVAGRLPFFFCMHPTLYVPAPCCSSPLQIITSRYVSSSLEGVLKLPNPPITHSTHIQGAQPSSLWHQHAAVVSPARHQ